MTEANLSPPTGVPVGFINSELTSELKKRAFRAEYYSTRLKAFLAAQIRALRGDLSQTEFGRRIGKPQSVVSRLERQNYGKVNLQTLIDIATKLDVGLIIRFVNLPTFLKWENDYSAQAPAAEPYNDSQMEDLLEQTKEPSESNYTVLLERAPFVSYREH
jgi:transcriptional regulator with XRE-family HTH domain